MSSLTRMSAKAIVLLAGWLIASLPPIVAIALWRRYGGTIYAPELFTVGAGHVLNAGLTIAIAVAAAAVAEHPSTAAILTLSVTVGTWIVNFIAAVRADCGNGPRASRRRRWWESSSAAWSGSTRCSPRSR